MENPTKIQVFGSWIWTILQEVYAFLSKPFAGIFLLLASIGWAWYVSDSKFQAGYDDGVKNQIESNKVNVINLNTQIKDLQAEKKTLQSEKQSLQARIDTIKSPDCMEFNNKVFDYMESVEKRVARNNQLKAARLQERQDQIRSIKAENNQLQNLIQNNKKQ